MSNTSPSFSDILYERVGAIARISLNRPRVRGAQSKNLLVELDEAFSVAEADNDVRVVIVASIGEHFSAGHDLTEGQASKELGTTEDRWNYESKYFVNYCLRIHDFPKPTIAQVQGACVAGGLMVANMCDLLVASEDAFFADPLVHTLMAASMEVLIHPWVMGMRQAKDLIYTGRRMNAQEAFDIGMINRLVPRDRLEETATALAEQVAKAAPFAMRMTKRSLNRTWDMMGFKNAVNAHFDTHELTHTTEEFRVFREAGISGAIKQGKSLLK